MSPPCRIPTPGPRPAALVRALRALALGAVTLGAACARQPGLNRSAAELSAYLKADTAAPPVSAERLWVMIVNGGARPAANHPVHLERVRAAADLYARAGVTSDHLAVFSGDGENEAMDVSTEPPEVPELQPFARTELGARLTAPASWRSSRVTGHALFPADEEGIHGWLKQARKRMRPDDVLVLQVVGHGLPHSEGAFALWEGQTATTAVMRDFIDRVPTGVRIVLVMSQDYAGTFVRLMDAATSTAMPAGDLCGYFSTPSGRAAQPLLRGEGEGPGPVGFADHGLAFVRALGTTGRFGDAHEEVLARTVSLDAPLRTSDELLRRMVWLGAMSARREEVELIDDQLGKLLPTNGPSAEAARLDGVADRYGLPTVRRLVEVRALRAQLEAALDRLAASRAVWEDGLAEAAEAALDRFLGARPEWQQRTSAAALAGASAEARRTLGTGLVGELDAFLRQRDEKAAARLAAFAARSRDAAALADRLDVRLAGVARLESMLTTLAGRALLDRPDNEHYARAYAALRACEDLTLALAKPEAELLAEGVEKRTAPPLPPLLDDLDAADALSPATIGARGGLVAPGGGEAAFTVFAVAPGSPAATAGLAGRDLLTSVAGVPLGGRVGLRSVVPLLPAGEAVPVELGGTGDRRALSLTPVPLPPLEEQRAGLVGTPAPALAGTAVRGRAPRTLEGDAPTLLFFWAPGCAACDRALPETLAHAADLGARVLAVTEASPAAVDAFLRRDDGPFPEIVLSDPERRTHAAYGVDGVPAIVSVDRGGLLRGFQLGHSVAHGVRLGDGTTGPRPGAAPPRR